MPDPYEDPQYEVWKEKKMAERGSWCESGGVLELREARRPGTSGRVLSPQRDHRITLAAPRICGPRGGHRMLCPYIFFDLLKRYITLHIAPVVFIIDNNLELY